MFDESLGKLEDIALKFINKETFGSQQTSKRNLFGGNLHNIVV